MPSTFFRSEAADIPNMLHSEYDKIKTQLRLAIGQGGEVAKAARALAQICLPHFELEEDVVLPFFERLQEVRSTENLGSVLAGIHSQLSDLSEEYQLLKRHHNAMRSASKLLQDAAYKEGNTQVTDLCHLLENHERIETDVAHAVHELAILRSH